MTVPKSDSQPNAVHNEDTLRHTAYMIKDLDDRSFRWLICECLSGTLVDFLWYMKDVDLIKKALRNMATRIAEEFFDDLHRRWKGIDPDNSQESQKNRGREALKTVLSNYQRLIHVGASNVPDYQDYLNVSRSERTIENFKNTKTYPSTHLAWLICLYELLSKARSEGLMAIEFEIEHPQDPSSLFQRYPQVLEQPYLEFATDVMSMICRNCDGEDLDTYVDYFISGLINDNSAKIDTDRSLLNAIWFTIRATMSGLTPRMAVEFGRQALPMLLKPKFIEFEDIFRDLRRSDREATGLGLDGAVDRFVASLSSGRVS